MTGSIYGCTSALNRLRLGTGLLVIMKPALENMQPFVPDRMDQPVLIVDPAAPAPGVIALQRLWFPDAFKRGPERIFDQFIDARKHFLICFLPIGIFLPCKGLKDELHYFSIS